MADPAIDALADLLTDVPHVMFCVKDAAGRYLAVNQAFADRAGRSNPADVVGSRASDLFPAELAASYDDQDAAIHASGRPLRNQLELILRPDGTVGWYVTSKTLVTDARGATAIASVSVDLRAPAEAGPGSPAAANAGIAAAVEFARLHSSDPITVVQLAEEAGLSVGQLERAVKRTLGLSAKQLLLRLRLEEAIVRLRTTDAAVAQIATECGYYDQSAFTRQFRRVVGMSPGAYRSALRLR